MRSTFKSTSAILLGIGSFIGQKSLEQAAPKPLSALSPQSAFPAGAPPPVAQPLLPLSLQIKKTVVFLEADCLHDFTAEVQDTSRERLLRLNQQEEASTYNFYFGLSLRLLNLAPSAKKLSPEDETFLKSPPSAVDQNALADQIAHRLLLIQKMLNLTEQELEGLKSTELTLLPADRSRGTGFIASVPDGRLRSDKLHPERTPEFLYLVTNRHVAEPGSQEGKSCAKPLSTFVTFNKKTATEATTPVVVDLGRHVAWKLPQDASVDLAIIPIAADPNVYDYLAIPNTLFVTAQMTEDKSVVEGDPVMFAGLFVQTYDKLHTLEPIVRSGALALLPQSLMETTIERKLGHVYLAEAHVFGGNSGSPIFVDLNRFQNGMGGFNYMLLGIVSGEMFENSDLTVNVTTTLSANVGANSGISVVVPAFELEKMLNTTEMKLARDKSVEASSASVKEKK